MKAKGKVSRRLSQLKNKCVFGARPKCRREIVRSEILLFMQYKNTMDVNNTETRLSFCKRFKQFKWRILSMFLASLGPMTRTVSSVTSHQDK